MGQHLEFVGTKKETSYLGYTSNKSLYQAMARELLTSDEGLMLRSRKSIESEVVFGLIKYAQKR
jgi:hypothetical protein